MKFLICILPFMALVVAEESAERQLVKSNNEFTARMFNEVAKIEKGQSVVMSGFSALSPLAQLGLASVGESHDEILKAIGMENDQITKDAFSSVNRNLRSVKGVELKIANRVYIPEGLELNQTFATMSSEVFGSDVKEVNFFKNDQAAATINAWVEDNTNNRIKDLIDPNTLDGNTKAVLVNAIFFKGSWDTEFDKSLTQDRDFHVSKDKTVQVPTMYRNGDFKYGYSKELKAKLLEIPYKGGEASFLIVLPDEIDGLTALQEELLDPSKLNHAVENMFEGEVDVYIPKFKIETTIDLKDVLLKMGVKKLFDSRLAKLDYLLRGHSDLFVSNAIQKAFIEVNEEGAEAAAASAYVVSNRASVVFYPKVVYTFNADKPFYYEIRTKTAVLFDGISSQ